jgi:hypothetical protein
MANLSDILNKRKYELLLVALIQHLFVGIILNDLETYIKVIWPINMLILGFASVGVYIGKSKWKKIIKNILLILVFTLPTSLSFIKTSHSYMLIISAVYVLFFCFIFIEIIKFLIKPSYINVDIISASACGYLLMIEISVFLMQIFFYNDPTSFKGVDATNSSTIYMDLVYFCSITFTSIGFGDITPNNHHTKLITSIFGVLGQFYSVVLVGILISKFSSKSDS